MNGGLTYREWAPPAHLRGTVTCVWGMWGEHRAVVHAQPIVPDGRPELVLNLADPFVRLADGGRGTQPTALLVGPTTAPTVVAPTGRVRLVGVRLHPWGGAALAGVPMAELRDQLLPAPDALGPWVTTLHERLAALPARCRAEEVFRSLESRLRLPDPGARLAEEAVLHIAAHRGLVTVKGLARRLHVAERTVQRVLRHQVGVPPKVLARILRLQEALARLASHPGESLARVALRCGYYDQAHFNREFRRLVGCPPTAYLAGERDLTDPFISGAGARTDGPAA